MIAVPATVRFLIDFIGMKIGLLTYHRNYNYGWNLQCYALMSVLKSMGHDVTLIDKRKFRHSSFRNIIKDMVKSFLISLGLWKRHNNGENEKIRVRNIAVFFDKYINPKTEMITNRKGYKNLPHFDALVVGSDQVWRANLVHPICDYFFDFVDYPAKMISYAASFGVDNVEYAPKEIKQCGKLIERFTAVSVREQSGAELIRNVYKWKCNPVVMPDPALLLTEKDYERIIKNVETEGLDTGLFCYILDRTYDKEKAINVLSQSYSLNPYCVYPNEDPSCPSVEEWLNCFKKAKFVFTDSFHGCVFSLIFHKPFLAYGNVNRGLARFTSLLEAFGQKNRLITSLVGVDNNTLSSLKTIDCLHISKIQQELQNSAIKYLFSNL